MIYWSALFFLIALVAGVIGLGEVSYLGANLAACAFFGALTAGVLFLVAGMGAESRRERRTR